MHLITSYPPAGASAIGRESKLSAQREQGSLPSRRKAPDVVSVRTTVEYLVLVLMEQAVT
jgi:hypothetical protein